MRTANLHALFVGTLTPALLLPMIAGVLLARVPGRADAPAPHSDTTVHRTYTERIPGTPVQFDMVAIPGGRFAMGTPPDEPGRAAEEGPVHSVVIRPFWIGRCEVTWDEYALYGHESFRSRHRGPTAIELADIVTRPSPSYIDPTRGFGLDRYPAVGITHHAAMEYCRWLSLVTGKMYRLPTEAEWEYACRAQTGTAYFFGNDASRLREFGWFDKNAEDSTHPVGLKKPNPWGLHDMYGNVSEWCLDRYVAEAYRAVPLDQLCLGPVQLPSADRYPNVVRGGSWAEPAVACRSGTRRASHPSWNRRDPQRPASIWWLADADFVGFRLVRPVEEQNELKGLRSKVTKDSK